jgi:anti-anti-sigma regulatory factor/nucleotide-binding universal stress UspA family protein
MIVTSSEDVVRLSGALVKNQWLTIKAAANLLLQSHPQGIIIDCAELTNVSEDGAKTFLEAIKDIQAAGARIVVCNLPVDVLRVVRSVPGVRSQLPIANSVEEARASLRLGGEAPKTDAEHKSAPGGIVIPLLPGLDIDYALTIACRLARDLKAPVHIVYLLEVARHLPLSSPLGEAEAAAQIALAQAAQLARKVSLVPNAHLERVRDVEEGLLQLLKTYQAGYVVMGAFAEPVDADRFYELVNALLRRAPCNVLIGRKAMKDSSDSSGPIC